MNKPMIHVILCVTALSLCACNNNINENVLETTEVVTQTTTATQTTIADEIQTSVEDDHIYSLEGMSVDEIVNEIYSLADISNGDNLGDYSDRFAVSPQKREGNSGEYFYFVAHDGIPNCIRSIGVQTRIEMDNTITVTTKGYIYISLQLSDYEIASGVYDRIYTRISSVSDWEVYKTTDVREGSSWEYRLDCEVAGTEDEYDQDYSNFATSYDPTGYYINLQPRIVMDKAMTSDGDLYIISIQLPIKYLAD